MCVILIYYRLHVKWGREDNSMQDRKQFMLQSARKKEKLKQIHCKKIHCRCWEQSWWGKVLIDGENVIENFSFSNRQCYY